MLEHTMEELENLLKLLIDASRDRAFMEANNETFSPAYNDNTRLLKELQKTILDIAKDRANAVQHLKDKIIDGWAMAHDPICSEGFKAADTLIKYYEEQLREYSRK